MKRRDFLQTGLLLGTAGLLPRASFANKRLGGSPSTLKAGDRLVLPIKGIVYPFRWCPPGTFTMGSPKSEAGRHDGETQHQVTLTRGFWMLETPVTTAMWNSITERNPRNYSGKFPVECVSWHDCQEYIQKLNGFGVTPSGYRFSLPTEAQWEYACRAGTTTPFYSGNRLNGKMANCNGKHPYGRKVLDDTTEVGSYPANAWGLYDMHGNVWEWCSDWFGDYPGGRVTDPVGPSSGSRRVLRGGSFGLGDGRNVWSCRSASRSSKKPSHRSSYNVGLRLSLARFE